MRVWIVAIAVLVACKAAGKPNRGAAEAAKAAANVPTVGAATVLATDEGKPPLLFIVDNAGTIRLAAAKTWADLDMRPLWVANRVTSVEPVDLFAREVRGLGRDPFESINSWNKLSVNDLELADLEDTRTSHNMDDPPPPEEEDVPDDGEEETGGQATPGYLEEGGTGKQLDRAEGQYMTMRKNPEDPQLARQQAIEQALRSSIFGPLDDGRVLPYADADKPRPDPLGRPTRVAEALGTVAWNGRLEWLHAMIMIAPTAPATTLVELVRTTDAAIAVSHEGKIRPLRLRFTSRGTSDMDGWFGFHPRSLEPDTWVEARLSKTGVVIEAVPGVPVHLKTLEPEQLAAALGDVRSARGIDLDGPVDVLVDADVDVQRLGMGSAPSPEELARRGHRSPMVILGQPSSQGDLDRKLIRRVLKRNILKLKDCYLWTLALDPGLAGTVSMAFFIAPDGTVATAEAVGPRAAGAWGDGTFKNPLDSSGVGSCFAHVIRKLTFPTPKGGGGVQVNYPFTLRP